MDEMPPFEELCSIFNYTPIGKPRLNEEAANVLRMKPGALDQLRFKGGGPRYFKPKGSRRVLYAEKDLLEYLYSGMRTSTSDSSEAAAA